MVLTISASPWRDIESAPKDGTEILAYGRYVWAGDWELPDFSRGNIGRAVVRWADRSDDPLVARGLDGRPDFDRITATGVWELVHENPYVDWMDATHWMPLPDPPK